MKTYLKFLKLLSSNKRPKIFYTIEMIYKRYKAGELTASVSIPPRYGKSDVIRGTALELTNQKLAPTSIVICPWENLVDQMFKKEDIQKMFERYGIPITTKFTTHRIEQFQTKDWWQLESGLPTMFGVTIHLGQNAANQQQFLDGIEDMHQRFRCLIPVFVDESQYVRDLKQWGRFVREISDRGGFIVLTTGTVVQGMPGFQEDPREDWREIVRYLPRRKIINSEIKIVKEKYEGQTRDVDIRADMEIPWSEAWDSGALEHANAVWVDVEVFDKDTEVSLGMLSEQPEKELSNRLRAIMESKPMIDTLVHKGMTRWLLRRKKEQDKTQLLVITGSDFLSKNGTNGSYKENNLQPRQFKKAIDDWLIGKGIDPKQYRIEIVTSVDINGEPNKRSRVLLDEFRNGKIDILIVKMMGLVGLDAEACKVAIFGSVLRKGPMFKQALTRALTAWGLSVQSADIILPDDKRMRKSFNQTVTDQGGASQTELEKTDEEIIEPESRSEWMASGGYINGYSDQTGEFIQGDYDILLAAIKAKYITRGLTDVDILKNHKLGGYMVSEEEKNNAEHRKQENDASGIRNLDEGLEDIKGTFGPKARAITNRYINYGSEKERWIKANRLLQEIAKQLCDVPKNIRVSKIDDVEKLKRLIAALPIAEKEVFRDA